MIRLILPVCEKDFPLVNLLGHRFIEFGDMKERSLLVTCCWKDSFEVPPFCDKMRPYFKEVGYYVMPDVPEDLGWPEAPNHLFYNTAQFLQEQENADPWLFCEPDFQPLWAGWLDAFDSEYVLVAKPFMGAINDTRFRDRVNGGIKLDGTHMVGAGIYPANFFTCCKSVHFLEHLPYDIEIQAEVVPQCHETKLIFHAHNTRNYKMIDGQVIGEDVNKPDPAGGIHHFYGGRPIPKGTAVIHGIKDDSLAKIPQEILDALRE